MESRRAFFGGITGAGAGALVGLGFGGWHATRAPEPPIPSGVDEWLRAAAGEVDSQPLLARAFNALAGEQSTISLPAGTHRLGSQLTVPSNVTLVLPRGSKLAGGSLRVEGSFEAGLYDVFDDVQVTFGAGARRASVPQWWGAKADGIADDTNALQAALDTRIVHLPAGHYRTTRELVVRNRSTIVGVGNSWSPTPATDSIIQYDGPTDPRCAVLRVATARVGIQPETAVTNVHLEKVVLSGGNQAGYGLYSVYCSDDSTFTDVTVRDCTQHGIFITEQWYSTYRNLVARNNQGCGITIGHVFERWRTRGVNGILFSNIRAAGNGSDRAFHEKSRPFWGYGVLFCPGAGSTLQNVVSEGNYGAGLIYDLGRSSTNRIDGGYLEANGRSARSDGVATRPWGMIVIGRGSARANSVSGLYLHGEVGDERAQAIWLTGDPPNGDLILRDVSFGHHVHAEWDRYRWDGFVYYGLRNYVVGKEPRA